jgi:hypothetical protein
MAPALVIHSTMAMLALAARIFGVLLFATAIWPKLRNFDEFTSIVARYWNARLEIARIAAMIVVALEVAVVLLLLTPFGGAVGSALAIILLCAFAAVMTMALLRGERELDCGCMSSALRQRVRPALVFRNLVLVLPVMNGLGSGAVLFVLNLAFGTFVALNDSFADLKRRYG